MSKSKQPICYVKDCQNESRKGSWFCEAHKSSPCYSCQGGGCPVCGGFGEVLGDKQNI